MATGTAGDLYVGIFGDQTALDAMFRALPPQATQTGKDTGSKFSAGFSSSFSGVSAKVGKSLGLGLADQIIRGAADALKGDKTIGVAITDTIKGIPIIGAVAGLVEAGIGAAMGTYDAEKAAAQAETLAAKMKAEAGRRLDIVEDIASVEAQLAQNAATAAGNERESAKIKLDAAKKVEDVLQREIKWAREDAKADAEADYFNIASGSANTALGAFKFEAYPPSMQKVVQERTMKAVEKLATQRAETAGVF